jgi:hypothetical protein
VILLSALIVLLFGYNLLSRRLEKTVVTGPMLFTTAGIAMALAAPAELAAPIDASLLLHLATDAAGTDLPLLWDIRALPLRLLGTSSMRSDCGVKRPFGRQPSPPSCSAYSPMA